MRKRQVQVFCHTVNKPGELKRQMKTVEREILDLRRADGTDAAGIWGRKKML